MQLKFHPTLRGPVNMRVPCCRQCGQGRLRPNEIRVGPDTIDHIEINVLCENCGQDDTLHLGYIDGIFFLGWFGSEEGEDGEEEEDDEPRRKPKAPPIRRTRRRGLACTSSLGSKWPGSGPFRLTPLDESLHSR